MSTSKHHKDHKNKVNQFKKQVMTQNAQNQIPRTHLIPNTEWSSTEMLEIRGDEADAIDKSLATAYRALQTVADAYRSMISRNIHSGKISMDYIWNNGEKATEAEVEEYKSNIAKIQALRAKQMDEAKAAEDAGHPEKEQIPGNAVLTDAWGSPVSSESKEAK